ncbi:MULTISPECIES: capsular polysaccharide biosynthesis protein Cps4B [unclassified Streptococcus]|uniref:capsular polysaccharide biosynthesis protein Cps4B n=1 Tax=unclassified Streptococcus TaxID=2608887 RepID=UPI0011B5A4F9|nr:MULTISPECIES: capsular polysaccharide biosynthesis protein Cps4B [unclassified Streptococcus]TWS94594.1 tyrosine protein phosphatase [Streptococcus sp. sy018]TWT14429.1 tyrosine protein phosphatase [Streptococcus sp. sy010]
MIDIHSHIIFDVDDGPKTLAESIALVTESYQQGVRTIVATSHRRKGMFETPEDKILANFQQLQVEMSERLPDLTLLYGGELYYSGDVQKGLENQTIPTMANTRFALIEFSMATPWKEIHKAATKVLLLGITPIIAHIERYNALEYDKKRVKELIDMGCYTQVNSSHVLKPKLFGDKAKLFKKRARFFLEENLVHCVASDMHNLAERKPYMKQAREIIAKDFGSKRAKDLFENNQKILLENDFI